MRKLTASVNHPDPGHPRSFFAKERILRDQVAFDGNVYNVLAIIPEIFILDVISLTGDHYRGNEK
jgi:hypothetical protein